MWQTLSVAWTKGVHTEYDMKLAISFYSLSSRGSWWRHQMEAFSALLVLCAGKSPVTVELSPQRPVTRSFDFFICAWTNGWANNRGADDLNDHHTHYEVIVMDVALILNVQFSNLLQRLLSCEFHVFSAVAFRWMTEDPIDHTLALVQCRNGSAPSGNRPLPESMLIQFMSPYGVIRLQLVRKIMSYYINLILFVSVCLKNTHKKTYDIYYYFTRMKWRWLLRFLLIITMTS